MKNKKTIAPRKSLPSKQIPQNKNSSKANSIRKRISKIKKSIKEKEPKKVVLFNEAPKNSKEEPFFKMGCPVPPWTSKSLIELCTYLNLSGAKLSQLIGIPYSTIRNWVCEKAKIENSKSFPKLEEFEKRISKLRKTAEEVLRKKNEAEKNKKVLLKESWSILRIRKFIKRMGLTQPEFAVFAGVSYDTVVSWCQGRRKLRRKDMATYFERMEKILEEKGFSEISDDVAMNSEAESRFTAEPGMLGKIADVPDNGSGKYKVLSIEKIPGVSQKLRDMDSIEVSPDKKNYIISLSLGSKSYEFKGSWVTQRDRKMIEILSDNSKYPFGKVGCIGLFKKCVVVNFWPTTNLPYRIIARIPEED
ncbi:MAG: hypothetical protein HQM08_09430 [Candidatus Riflebacteria bacterium]|nr:hypothetical protein [Candidatus Riflebacteria bacterium]